jgi:hypothetical protein
VFSERKLSRWAGAQWGHQMSLYKVFLLSGAAAFVSSAVLAAEFNGRDVPLHASAVAGFHGIAHNTQRSPAGHPKTAKCGTGFGARLPSPDGVISWNDTTGSGFDTSGAADFTCSVKTKINQVWVTGFQGADQEQFNVTFYKNDPAGGSDEPNDSQVVCAYTGLVGAAGGFYGDVVLAKLKLPAPCKFKAGKKYWVSVQSNDSSAGPWYWEMSSTLQGAQGDWVDRHNEYATGCTTFDNEEYSEQCFFPDFQYPDYMLELH